jgi:hypothetical protein
MLNPPRPRHTTSRALIIIEFDRLAFFCSCPSQSQVTVQHQRCSAITKAGLPRLGPTSSLNGYHRQLEAQRLTPIAVHAARLLPLASITNTVRLLGKAVSGIWPWKFQAIPQATPAQPPCTNRRANRQDLACRARRLLDCTSGFVSRPPCRSRTSAGGAAYAVEFSRNSGSTRKPGIANLTRGYVLGYIREQMISMATAGSELQHRNDFDR